MCGGLRNCTVHGQLTTSWSHDEYPIYGYHHHHLLQCNGCDAVFYHHNEHFSEHTTHEFINGEWKEIPIDMITTFPPMESSFHPIWISKIESVDPQLFQLLTEMYASFEKEHFILASIGLRTVFDRTTEILKIHPGLKLEEKVAALKAEGYVGDTEASVLSSVIDAGNAAAHRGWSPKKIEFMELLDVIEKFVERTILSKKTLEHITQQIPRRPPRPKKLKQQPNTPS